MPIKDFQCSNCKVIQERICKTDQKEVNCKACGSIAYSMLSAPGSIQFKGSGFYETDYKHKG